MCFVYTRLWVPSPVPKNNNKKGACQITWCRRIKMADGIKVAHQLITGILSGIVHVDSHEWKKESTKMKA